MTSSALEVLDSIEDNLDYSKVVLHEGAIKGLYANQREALKRNVALANEAWETSGAAMRGCAACLVEIKDNTPRGNWTALLKGGDLNFSESVAKDLVSAHEWLASSSIPDRFLANISARTLGTVARLTDPKLIQEITSRIIEVEGKGFPETELRKMLKKGVKVNRTKAGKAAKKELDANASRDEIIEHYTKIVNQMQAQLDQRAEQFKKSVLANQDKAAEIGRLKEQIKELKASS